MVSRRAAGGAMTQHGTGRRVVIVGGVFERLGIRTPAVAVQQTRALYALEPRPVGAGAPGVAPPQTSQAALR